MKAFILASLMIISTQAFAELPIIGQWYHPYVEFANGGYSPEILMKISTGDRVTLEILFPGKIQKQVVVYKSVLTPQSRQDIAVLAETDCGNIFLTDLFPNSYTVKDKHLRIAGSDEFVRANQQQIQRFSSLSEGCN